MKHGVAVLAFLLAITWLRVLRADELSIRLDVGDEEAPGQVCLFRDARNPGFQFDPELFKPGGQKNARLVDAALCVEDSCQDCTRRPKVVRLELFFKSDKTPALISDLWLVRDTVRVRYLQTPAPPVVTVRTRSDHGHDYYGGSAAVWTPPLGSAPLALTLVPTRVDRRLALPDYECPLHKTSPPSDIKIDRNWAVQEGERSQPFPGCDGADQDVVQFQIKPMSSAKRKEDALPVLIQKFGFWWEPHCLSEAEPKPGAIEVVANDRALNCRKPAEWDGQRFRFECVREGGPMPVTTFPIAVTLAVGSCSDCTWKETLHHPGEVLRGYLPDAERSMIVKWPEEWKDRAAWQADRILAAELATAFGTVVRLNLPEGSSCGWQRQRYLVPGLECGQAFTLRFRGDRSFREQTLELGDASGPGTGPTKRTGNELLLPAPIGDARANGHTYQFRKDTVGLGGRLAGGAAGYFGQDGVSRNGWVSKRRRGYATEFAELELYAVMRRDRPLWGRRHDWELGVFGTYHKWPSHRWDLGSIEQSRTRRSAQRAVLLGMDIGFKRSLGDSFFWGLAATGGGNVAAHRERVDGVPTRPFLGGRASADWYVGRAVALELVLRVLWLKSRFTRFNLNGVGDTWTDSEPSGWLSLGLRIDDLVGD